MKRIITFFSILLTVLLLSPVTANAEEVVQKEKYEKTADDGISVNELMKYSKAKNGEWLVYVRTWIPRTGAVLFVAGIIIAVVSTKSNSQRKWGIRIAVIESIVAFIFYVAACITYDRYYWSGTPEEASAYYVERYEGIRRGTEGMMTVYEQSIVRGNSATVSVLKILQYSLTEYMITLAVVSFFMGIGVFILNPGRKTAQRWAVIGLCFIIPVAMVVGAQIIG